MLIECHQVLQVKLRLQSEATGSSLRENIKQLLFVLYNKLSLAAELSVGQKQLQFYELHEKLTILIPGRLINDENITGVLVLTCHAIFTWLSWFTCRYGGAKDNLTDGAHLPLLT